MKKVIIGFLLIVSAYGLTANDGYYVNGRHGMLYPSHDSDISMTSEVINVNFHINPHTVYVEENADVQAHYSCTYTFKNNSDQPKTVLVGFPIQLGHYVSSTAYYPEYLGVYDVHNFVTLVDGLTVPVEEKLDGGEYDIVYSFEASWEPQQEITITHTYDVLYGFTNMKSAIDVSYIVKTGNTWAEPIGDAVFNFTVHKPLTGPGDSFSNYALINGCESAVKKEHERGTTYSLRFRNWTPVYDINIGVGYKDYIHSQSQIDELNKNAPAYIMEQDEFQESSQKSSRNRVAQIAKTLAASNGDPDLYRLPALMFAHTGYTEIKEYSDELEGYFSLLFDNIFTSDNPVEHGWKINYILLNYDTKSLNSVFNWRQLIYTQKLPEWFEAFKNDEAGAVQKVYAALKALETGSQHWFGIVNLIRLQEKHDYYRSMYYLLSDYFYDSNPEIALWALRNAFFLTSTVKTLYEKDHELYHFMFYHPTGTSFKYRFPNDISWIDEGPDNAPCYYIAYNMACLYATELEDYEQAFYWLEFALKMGYPNYDWLQKDSDMQYLRDNYSERFAELISKYNK